MFRLGSLERTYVRIRIRALITIILFLKIHEFLYICGCYPQVSIYTC